MHNWIELATAFLKGIGLLLTGVFGIIGAMTDFKTSEGKPTKWGQRNLVALVVCLAVALTAQVGDFMHQRDESASAAMKAAAAAVKLEAVAQNIERVVDPLGTFRTEFSVSIPANADSGPGLLEFASFCKRLDMIATSPANFDGQPIVTLCRECPGFPRLPAEPISHSLLTSRAEVMLFFFKPTPGQPPRDPFGSEPNMSLSLAELPDVSGLSTYNPRTKRIYLTPRSQRVRLDDNYYEESMRSVRDLVGARLAVEIRLNAPDVVGSGAIVEWLNIEFPGRRELSFSAPDFQRVTKPGKPTYFVHDFPGTWDEFKRKFAP